MVEFIEAEELQQLLLEKTIGVKVVDVRDEDWNGGGHIRGATNVPSSTAFWYEEERAEQLAAFVHAMSEDASLVVLHCAQSRQRGPRCAKIFVDTLDKLSKLERKPAVKVLRGGFELWKERNFEVEA